jgi:hypothetical protein
MSRGLHHQDPIMGSHPPFMPQTISFLRRSSLNPLRAHLHFCFSRRSPILRLEEARRPTHGTYLISPQHGHRRPRIAGMWLVCFARRCLEVYICGYTCSCPTGHEESPATAAPMQKVQLESRAIVPAHQITSRAERDTRCPSRALMCP